ncbi:MAG: pentapeptide repeat-containing protein [Streptosporangiaceae bacterium]
MSAGQAHSLFPDKISSFAFPARGLPVLTNAVLTNAVLTNAVLTNAVLTNELC